MLKNKKKILVADDETLIRKVLNEELVSAGYAVDTAENGREAIDKIKNNKYDLVLLDNKMPKADGIEVLEFINTNRYSIIVIMMTAFGTINHAVDAMKLGAYDYITKPFKMNEMVEKIRLAFKGSGNVSFMPEEEASSLLLGESTQIKRINEVIDRVKDTRATVLITGESGTGKGVVAREIHKRGDRRNEPFIHVNCAVLPANLIESELFGHAKGAFTGAIDNKKGKFEIAGKGTIFLDEIGLLNHSMQAKLLTVIQEREFQRIGSNESMEMTARIIAATNEDLKNQVEMGKFRKDLYYRLNVISILCIPLRERKGDIELLVSNFIDKFNKLYEKKIMSIENEALKLLESYDWPGNVRELENIIERIVAMSMGGEITAADVEDLNLIDAGESRNKNEEYEGSLEKQEIFAIIDALKRNDGHREKTAKDLGISRRTLQYKIKKYNLS